MENGFEQDMKIVALSVDTGGRNLNPNKDLSIFNTTT